MRKTWTHLMVSDLFYLVFDDTVFCLLDDKPYCPVIMATIQTLGRNDLSGCFLVHICAFYSSYSSNFAFLFTSAKIFRAKIEPGIRIKI